MNPVWTVLLLLLGTAIFWTGWRALKTGEVRSNYGRDYTGNAAKALGWFYVVVGPIVAVGPIIRTVFFD